MTAAHVLTSADVKRAVIYTRISRDATGEGRGVDRQEDACRALAAARGWQVVGVVTENDTSATKGRRRLYRRMIADAGAGRYDVIVSWAVDRLTRSPLEVEELIALSERTGVRVATVSGDLDLTTDAGRMVGRILGTVARGEVERKATRQKAANMQRADRGEVPSGRSFGYRGGAAHPAESAALREAYAGLLAGKSLVALAREVSTASGRRIGRTTLRDILLNPKNAGIRVHRDTEVGPGSWPPIVTEETFRAAVALLTDSARNHGQSRGRRWIGGSLYRCGRCGSDMKVIYRGGGERAYQCRASRHLTRTRADDIDATVQNLVVARLQMPGAADLLAGSDGDNTARIAELRLTAAGLRARGDQLGRDYADGLLTGRQLAVATERVSERLADVQGELARLGRSGALPGVLAAPDPGAAFLAAEVAVRQQVADALATITLLPIRPGRRGFDESSIRVDWHQELG